MSDGKKLRDAIMEALDDNDAFSASALEVTTVLEAIDAAGFAVVPKVATEAMLAAADEERNGWRRQPSSVHGYAWIYAAMLAAAPKVTP